LELRSLLGSFLFSGDTVEKKIKVLSGGEKARVALAKTIASKANFLMLDEPTNHLDIHSVDLLVEALNKYEGSFILVSHDRYFISRLANKIWEIDDHKIREFKGTYKEWEDWKERRLKEKEKEKAAAPVKEVKEEVKAKEEPAPVKSNKPINQEQKKELNRIKNKVKQLEEKLAVLNNQKTALEAQLADPAIYSDKDKFIKAETDYNKAVADFNATNSEFEEAFEKLMEMEDNS
ncbi:MAG: ABC-F family ATP-binding cassette domain-containing protein, partial [Bacteroidetes bacterium]|nr:ABC-F family ATP-binding cassette domain-containing protein [Bacteroidota bacterium]